MLLMATVLIGITPGTPPAIEYTSLLGDPGSRLLSLLGLALSTKYLATAAGVAAGLVCKAKAATPATAGLAIEVPLMVVLAVALVYQAEVMDEPGAKISTQAP